MKNNIINMYKDDKLLLNFLCAFLIIQPFLDIKFFFENSDFQLFGLAIPTVIRCVGILVISLLSLKNIKKDKYHLFYAVYFVLLAVYFVVHHVVASGNVEVPPSYSYSLFNELFYIIRMVFPFLIVYMVKYVKITYKRFISIILYSSIIIGAVILISNLLHISPPSYAVGGKKTALNIIEWFTVGNNVNSFESYTSKGWFYMANQISGLMVLLLPLNYYDLICKPKVINIMSSLLLSVSMLILGTRVSSYGLIGILSVMLVLAIFFALFRKNISIKNMIVYLVLFAFMGFLFLNSPVHNRVYSYGQVEEVEGIEGEIEETTTSKISREQFVLSNYQHKKIQKVYIYKIYPYNQDTDFWFDFIKNNTGEVTQNREMQSQITNRISDLNSSVKYDLFGFSFSRFRNGYMYIESDFIVHYYTIGIIGIILLLSPWIIILLKGVIYSIKNKCEKMNFFNTTMLLSISVCLAASVFSGHIVDELIVTLYLGVIAGYLLNVMKEESDV